MKRYELLQRSSWGWVVIFESDDRDEAIMKIGEHQDRRVLDTVGDESFDPRGPARAS